MKTLFILNLMLFIGSGLCSCSREMENLGLQKIEKSLYGSWEYSDDEKFTERKLSFQKMENLAVMLCGSTVMIKRTYGMAHMSSLRMNSKILC